VAITVNSPPTFEMLHRVELSPDAVSTCLSHALSTEYQEVMGLLLGRFIEEGSVAKVSRVMVLTRKDKQRDRVEVSYEQLAQASTVAEELSALDGVPTNVVGWYHSHPHITVFPSHVDCRTQGQLQVLDKGFIGVIFSVFNKGRLDVCAFQSRNIGTVDHPDWQRLEVPVVVASDETTLRSRTLEHLVNLNYVLVNEERIAFDGAVDQTTTTAVSDSPSVRRSSSGITHCNAVLLSTAYKQNLSKILELQLLPMLGAVQSKYNSRVAERAHLLAEIDKIEKRSGTRVSSAHPKDLSVGQSGALQESAANFDGAMRSLRTTAPQWWERARTLQIATSGFKVSSVPGKVSSDLPRVGPCTALVDRNFLTLQPPVRPSQQPVSPWKISFNDKHYNLLGASAGTTVGILEVQVSQITSADESCTLSLKVAESPEIVELLRNYLSSALGLNMIG
jgi:BRCA1/BRCA2-containing complex subunit 3